MTKTALLAAGATIAMCTGAYAGGAGYSDNGNTTVVHNGDSVTIVTQSGDPSQATVHVTTAPGKTTIYRQSGGNTAIVTQSTGPADLGALPDWLKDRLPR
jgi:hypothetical protein